jgi:hypothetical protein
MINYSAALAEIQSIFGKLSLSEKPSGIKTCNNT